MVCFYKILKNKHENIEKKKINKIIIIMNKLCGLGFLIYVGNKNLKITKLNDFIMLFR